HCMLVYFLFFQAEDGIRYRNVTGVQTCALPISRGVLAGAALAFGDRASGPFALLLPARCRRRSGRRLGGRLRGGRRLGLGILGEIGRASCRERAESRGVGGALMLETHSGENRRQ